jgi:hypothetical protein
LDAHSKRRRRPFRHFILIVIDIALMVLLSVVPRAAQRRQALAWRESARNALPQDRRELFGMLFVPFVFFHVHRSDCMLC